MPRLTLTLTSILRSNISSNCSIAPAKRLSTLPSSPKPKLDEVQEKSEKESPTSTRLKARVVRRRRVSQLSA